MIALLFLLILVAMILLIMDKEALSYVCYVIALLLSIYWFHFHATSQLNIVL